MGAPRKSPKVYVVAYWEACGRINTRVYKDPIKAVKMVESLQVQSDEVSSIRLMMRGVTG